MAVAVAVAVAAVATGLEVATVVTRLRGGWGHPLVVNLQFTCTTTMPATMPVAQFPTPAAGGAAEGAAGRGAEAGAAGRQQT